MRTDENNLRVMPARFGPQRITTNSSMLADLRASLSQHPHYYGDTVGDFIDALLRLVPPETPLAHIEVGVALHGTGRLRLEWNEHGAAEIREMVGGHIA